MDRKGVHRIVVVAGHKNDVQVGLQLFKGQGQRQAAHAAQLDIQKGRVDGVAAGVFQRRPGRGEGRRKAARRRGAHGLRQAFQRQRFIVYN